MKRTLFNNWSTNRELRGAKDIKMISTLRRQFGVYSWIRKHPLSVQRPISPIFRWLGWHLGSRLVPGPVVVPFVNDAVLVVQPGMTGLTLNVFGGLAEPNEMSLLLHFLRPGDTFVDVGANAGAYTVLAGGVVGADVLSVEPVPTSYHALVQNVLINGVSERVQLFNVALGEEVGSLRMTADKDAMNHVSVLNEASDCIEVPVATLDGIMEGGCSNAIKIDVEGFELCVLKGGRKTFENPKLSLIIVELNGAGRKYGHTDQDVREFIEGHGFFEVYYGFSDRKIKKNKGVELHGLEKNSIFVRDECFVQNRVDNSNEFSCYGTRF